MVVLTQRCGITACIADIARAIKGQQIVLGNRDGSDMAVWRAESSIRRRKEERDSCNSKQTTRPIDG